jgi:hypothetical protein
MPEAPETFVLFSFSWTFFVQLVLMAGVLAYGIWHYAKRRPFNLLVLIFWIVCGYLTLAVLLVLAGLFYRGESLNDLTFALGNFMNWAMTIVLFGFLPMTLLAAFANTWADKRNAGKTDADG